MIKLINGNVQNATGQLLNGSLTLQLTQDTTVIASPGTVVSAIPITFPILNGNLVGTCQVYSNAELTPQTQYIATFKDSNGSKISQSLLWQFNQAAGATVDIGTMVTVGGGVTFPGPVLLNPGADQHILGVFNLTTPRFNNVFLVDGVQFTTIAAAVSAAAAAPGGGTVWVPPNYSETLTANLVLRSNVGILFLGPATINMGSFQVTAAGGLNGASIKAIGSTSTLVAAPSVQWIYTGNSDAWVLGDSSANSQGLRLENFAILTTTAGSSAVALHLKRFIAYSTHGVNLFGPGGVTSQIGYLLDGTGGVQFTGDSVNTLLVSEGFLSNVQLTNVSNLNLFVQPIVSNPATNGFGFDFQNASGNVVIAADIENITGTGSGVNFANSANVLNNQVQGWFENNANDVALGASCAGNLVDSLTGNLKVTGAGAGANNNLVKGTVKGTLLNFQPTTGTLTGNSADQTVYTFTIPANTLGAAKGFRLSVWFTHPSGGNPVTYKIGFGGAGNILGATTVSGTGTFQYQAVVMNNPGATNAQTVSIFHNVDATAGTPGNTMFTTFSPIALAIDTTLAQVVNLTFNVANTDTVKGGMWLMELIY